MGCWGPNISANRASSVVRYLVFSFGETLDLVMAELMGSVRCPRVSETYRVGIGIGVLVKDLAIAALNQPHVG